MQRRSTDLKVRGGLAAALLLGLSTLVAAPLAGAATAASTELAVTRVDTAKHPYVRIEYTSSSDERQLPDFNVEENGKEVSNVQVFSGKIGRHESNPKPVIFLSIDASNTMAGAKLEKAKSAAIKLIEQAKPGDRIGLIAFGKSAKVLHEPTEDLTALAAEIAKIQISHGTQMYDSVKLASKNFPDDATRRIVVLLADGEDVRSKTSLEGAIKAADKQAVEVYSVGIEGKVFRPDALRELSLQTGGTFQSVPETGDLNTVYALLGKRLLRGYWLEYRSSQPGGVAVKVDLSAKGYDHVTHSYMSPAVRASTGTLKIEPLPRVAPVQPTVNLPGGRVGMTLAALPFAAILAFMGVLFVSRRARPNLAQRIDPYIKRHTVGVEAPKKKGQSFMAPAFALTESLLGKSSMFKRFRFLLEQANLPLREVELLWIMIAAGGGGAVLGFIFGGASAMLAGVGLLVGFAVPYRWIKRKARKRKKKFEEQLADVLGTISSSLKAGHSFNQSINAVIKETPNPTAEELSRVLTEARLGLPLEAALDAMAARMGSDDFDFAVTTVNIQRTVGGSLSEILEMVGDTVRNRQQFKKKVKALTSMGSMSAYVLLGMPVFMAGVLTLLNRAYIAPLFVTTVGHYLLIAGGFFMLLGYVACKKIVTIKC